jgi:EmrB/QacA subfamily drug resistance transporter
VAGSAARWTLIASILGSSMVFIDGTVVNVALPALQRDLGGGLATQQWVVDAYLLTLGSLILVGGSLGDIFGELKMFKLGVLAFGLTSVLCAVAPDSTTLIIFRALQGIAGALLTPASLAMITTTFSGSERGAAIGTWTAWSGISTVVGPLLGGFLLNVTTWRIIFVLNVPLALATLALVMREMPRERAGKPGVRVDVIGAALCAIGLGGIVAGFIEQPRLGWSDPVVAGGIAGGALFLVAFVVYESRVPAPMLPLGLFRSRNFSVTNLETLAVYGALSALFFFLTLFLQQLSGYSPFRSGLAGLPVTIIMFILSRQIGALSMRFGPRLFMAVGPIIAGVSVTALVRLPRHLDYWTELLPTMIGFAIGLSLTVAPLTTTVLSDAGPGNAGIASGVNNAVARIAGLVAIAAIGIAAAGGTDHLSVSGFHRSMAVCAALLIGGGLIAAAGIRNPSTRSAGSPAMQPSARPTSSPPP